ncbi:MAG: hypothetical protein JWO81_131 [Alphaproteobacteria bacterium]|nr:hypothetical protein [Alphaproteobacteria bacterium]
MKTFVFVHGTGVREASYSASFSLIQQQLNAKLGPLSRASLFMAIRRVRPVKRNSEPCGIVTLADEQPI